LRPRVEKALREGRTQQALELAKQLYKQEPNPEHRDALKRVVLERARRQREQGKPRDAVATLQTNLTLDPADFAWLSAAAEELARAGAVDVALPLLLKINDPDQRERVLAHIADQALERGDRNLLPEDLRPAFDAVRQAFVLAEKGEDDTARAALQAIGLHSPFLDWKLLLRGLIAFWQKNEALALENWQRLRPDRLPARLAAPLRIQIDPAFRAAQAPATQLALQKAADRLLGNPLIPALRGVQVALARGEGLQETLRLAESLIPLLRREAPHLLPRLASCFFFAVVEGGDVQDVERYKRLFGAPPEDPSLARLSALTCEHQNHLPDAIEYWQKFEAAVARHPKHWRVSDRDDRVAQANRVRALIWERIGQQMMQAAEDLDDESGAKDIEACFRKSIELAPDRAEPHRALFEHHVNANEQDKAEEIGRLLIERFPNQPGFHEQLGDVRMRCGEFGAAVQAYERALAHQPANRDLRSKLVHAQVHEGRALCKRGRMEEARKLFAAALAQDSKAQRYQLVCLAALGEFEGGDPQRAEELIEEAQTACGSRLAVAYYMLTNIASHGGARALKKRWEDETAAALAQPPDPTSVVPTLQLAAAFRMVEDAYRGRAGHEKKLLVYVQKGLRLEYSEAQLESLLRSLVWLEARRLFDRFIGPAERRYPRNPVFLLQRVRADMHTRAAWRAGELLERTRELALELPEERRLEVLRELEQIRREQESTDLDMADDLRAAFGKIFGELADDMDDDDEPRRQRRRSR
jgi:tetratricopeptide (TPR) repeat protein